MLVRGSGKAIPSSSDVCISRVEGIKCLFCKARVAKSGPPAPMIHGALHFRVCDGYIIRILCRRTIRPRRISPCLCSRVWVPAVGSMTGSIPEHSPANAFPEKAQAESDTVGCDCQGEYLQNHTSLMTTPMCLRLSSSLKACPVRASLSWESPDVGWRTERLPFGAQDSAVGEVE